MLRLASIQRSSAATIAISRWSRSRC